VSRQPQLAAVIPCEQPPRSLHLAPSWCPWSAAPASPRCGARTRRSRTATYANPCQVATFLNSACLDATWWTDAARGRLPALPDPPQVAWCGSASLARCPGALPRPSGGPQCTSPPFPHRAAAGATSSARCRSRSGPHRWIGFSPAKPHRAADGARGATDRAPPAWPGSSPTDRSRAPGRSARLGTRADGHRRRRTSPDVAVQRRYRD
jgi:hypothetical protein